MKTLATTLRLALPCLTLAVLLGGAGLGWAADFKKGADAYKRGDYAAALKEWKPLAKQGNAKAQIRLGWMYYLGDGVPKDVRIGLRWWHHAAARRNAEAQNNLGVVYANGYGVLQDYKTALKWYRLVAAQGNAEAQKELGKMYYTGEGVSQNYKNCTEVVAPRCCAGEYLCSVLSGGVVQ